MPDELWDDIDLMEETNEESMEYIDKVGTELEGSFGRSKIYSEECWCGKPNCKPNWHDDGSISVNGEDCSNCECADNCECDGCLRCHICEEPPDYCTCTECMVCQVCQYVVGQCHCNMASEDCELCRRVQRGELPPSAAPLVRGEPTTCEDCYDNYRADHWQAECERIRNVRSMCQDPVNCGCCSCNTTDLIDKELVSPPLHRKDLAKWIEDHYPDDVNGSCSAHLHVSFKKIRSYSILMNRMFTETITTGLAAWGREHTIRDSSNFWSRVRGTCERWSANLWRAYEQLHAHTKGEQRYTMINYCYAMRNTMEFRVAHIFKDKKLTIKQHERILSIIDEYLTKERDSLRTLYLGLNTNIGGEE